MKSVFLLIFLTYSSLSFAIDSPVYIEPKVKRSMRGFIGNAGQYYVNGEGQNQSLSRVAHQWFELRLFESKENYQDFLAKGENTEVSDEVLLRGLMRYLYFTAAFVQDAPDSVRKVWSEGEQDWQNQVKPFFGRHEDELFHSASLRFTASQIMRYLILILGSREAVLDYARAYPVERDLKYIHMMINNYAKTPLKDGKARGEERFARLEYWPNDSYGDVHDSWALLNLVFPDPVFDEPSDCSKPSPNSREFTDRLILRQHEIVERIMEARPVRNQIGDTCYANLAAEMVDVHRDVHLIRTLDASPWSQVPLKNRILDLPLDFQKDHGVDLESLSALLQIDVEILRSYPGYDVGDYVSMAWTRQGSTSAYHASAIYTLVKEGSKNEVRNFDFGNAEATIANLLKWGGCPQSPWETGADNRAKYKENYQVFDLIRFVGDPDGYKGDTPREELLDALKTFAGLSQTMHALGDEASPGLDRFLDDPQAFLREQGFTPELLQKVLLHVAAMSTCGSAAIRREEKVDVFNLDLEDLNQLSPAMGRAIKYPKGYTRELFNRHHRDRYNYQNVIKDFNDYFNSSDFQGIGISVCNKGLIHHPHLQFIIDLDRLPYGGNLKMLNGYNFEFRLSRYGSTAHSDCAAHTYLVTDLRYNAPLKQCEYKLRNSWGKYKTYNRILLESGWIDLTDDDKFDFWSPSHLIYRNLQDAIVIQPSYKLQEGP